MMKHLLQVILTFTISVCHSQQLKYNELKVNETYLKEQSLEIMKILKIDIRKNIYRDYPLTYKIDSSLLAFRAVFSSENVAAYTKQNGDMDTSTIFHIKPSVTFSARLDSLFNGKLKVNRGDSVRAVSKVIHEFTHYHQVTYNSTDTLNRKMPFLIFGSPEYREYLKKPTEIEAYAVSYYFILYFLDKKTLDKIMKLNIDEKDRWMLLINEGYVIEYPWRDHVFPELNPVNKK